MRVSSGCRDSKGIILFSGRVPGKFEVDTCCQWVQCPSSGWSLGTCRPATSKIIISRAKKVSIEEQVNWCWVNSCEILRLFWGGTPMLNYLIAGCLGFSSILSWLVFHKDTKGSSFPFRSYTIKHHGPCLKSEVTPNPWKMVPNFNETPTKISRALMVLFSHTPHTTYIYEYIIDLFNSEFTTWTWRSDKKHDISLTSRSPCPPLDAFFWINFTCDRGDGVKVPINGRKEMGNWGYKPYLQKL